MDQNLIPEVVYSESSNSDQGANNITPFPIPAPGEIVPYTLPEGNVERPFDAISACAITEIGAYAESTGYEVYPLNEEELKELLRQKIDGRKKGRRIKDVVEKYTENKERLRAQLDALRRRIEDITKSEKNANHDIKRRLQNRIETALKKNLNPPQFNPNMLNMTLAAKEALRDVGSQGPLDASELFRFIDTGTCDVRGIPKYQLLEQVTKFRLSIDDRTDEGKHEIQLPLTRINKAIDELLTEMSRL